MVENLPETLDKLSRDEDWDVRCGVAKNENTSKETLFVMVMEDPEIANILTYRKEEK